ncbi:type II toxin-antitoxin system Phd/YefM family antitoxin [Luteimicrobium xylanilyticum]|nr:type II toxin-antitoxin system Phd/YefM family antitoxin [Luteimicrobium xylanilyticum]
MKVDTRDLRSASWVGRNFGAVTDEVEAGRTIVVMKNNRPAGVVAPISVLESIDAVEEREENVRLLALALVRAETTSGRTYTLEETAAGLGIDLDELASEESDDTDDDA